jgi:hypothetical protein
LYACPEVRLELLDDLAVAAHRAVEALQVAVHDEDQVVELLAACQRDRAEALGLVRLAVADERPHLAALARQDFPIFEVFEEAGLVDGHQRPEAHRDGREVPELRHQARVRIRGEAPAVHLPAEMVELLFGDAALEERARVDAGRRVALEVDQIAAEVRGRRAKEMIEADVVEGRGRGEARDVPAQRGVDPIRLDHHRHRVPANDRPDATLDRGVPGAARLVALGDRVDVGGVRAVGKMGPLAPGAANQPTDEVVGALDPLVLEDRVERFEPLLGLLRIAVGRQ